MRDPWYTWLFHAPPPVYLLEECLAELFGVRRVTRELVDYALTNVPAPVRGAPGVPAKFR